VIVPEAHSKFSASASDRWIACPGSLVLQKGKPDRSSVHADEGTAAHTLAEWCLTGNRDAAAFIGRLVTVDGDRTVEVTDEMAASLQPYIDQVREYAVGGELLVEQRVNYSEVIGVNKDDGFGTSDAIIVKGNLLIVVDLKFGRGVEVDAVGNTQMQLYALGALAALDGIAGDFERVLMVISQPRVSSAPKEWEVSVQELRKFGATVFDAAGRVAEAEDDYPSGEFHEKFTSAGDHCKWCKAKASCPTLRAAVSETVFDIAPATPEEFEALVPEPPTSVAGDNSAQWLAACLGKVDMIEDWCKAIRAETETRMLAGDEIPGYKLVQGKKGNRAWSDKTAAEAMLKTFRLKQEQMYEFSLISPTTADKLAKAGDIGERQWPKLKALITQSEGKLHVAPVSDKREAVQVKPLDDEFSAVAETVDDLA
jgi:hypothetical protein